MGSSNMLRPKRPTSEKQRGKPNHFQMKLFVRLSILLTSDMGISQTFRGHSTRWYNVCSKHHTLYFPGRWLRSIHSKPSVSCCLASFPICLSEKSAVYSLPRLLNGFSSSRGMDSPPITKMVLTCITPFLIERLLVFSALLFIRAAPHSFEQPLKALEESSRAWSRLKDAYCIIHIAPRWWKPLA